MVKIFMYSFLVLFLFGCGSKVIMTKEPSSISNIQIEPTEDCDIERK